MPDAVWRTAGGVPEKRCPTCGARGRDPWHPLESYATEAHRTNGISINCKQCLHENWQRWEADTNFDAAAYQRGYQRKPRDGMYKDTNHRYYERRVAEGWRKVGGKWVRREEGDNG